VTGSLRVARSQLGRLEPLGKGGTAQVYRVPELRLPELPGTVLVYKEYNDKTKKLAGPALGPGLDGFVRFREKLADAQRSAWDARIIWPVRVVVEDGGSTVAGIIMPIIPDRFFQDFITRSGPPKRKPRVIDTLFGDAATMKRVGIGDIDTLTRLRIVQATAAAYGMMHRQKVVVGDISAFNLVYDPDPKKPGVLVVDVDSARIEGHRAVFSSQPHTPNWEPPEARRAAAAMRRSSLTESDRDRWSTVWATQSMPTDVYKFGLLVVRSLDPGRGSAVRRDPDGAKKVLQWMIGSGAVDLLDRSLSDSREDRPTMREWWEVLQNGKGASSSASGGRPKRPASLPGGSGGAQSQKPQASPTAIARGARIGKFEWDGTGWVRV
jgi:hypothetical protein